MSSSSIFARALKGSVEGGMGAIEKSDERATQSFDKQEKLETQFAWGNLESARKKEENLARFGQQKDMAVLQSGLRVSAAQTVRGQVKQEGIDAVKQGITARMEALGIGEDKIGEANKLADAGLSPDIILGTPGKPLSPEGIKQVSEAVEKLLPDGTPEERVALAGEIEKKITAGTYGVMKQAAATKTAKEQAESAAAMKQTVDKAAATLSTKLTENPEGGLTQFRTLVEKRPAIAAATLRQLQEQGYKGPELKQMERILAIADKNKMRFKSGGGGGGVLPNSANQMPAQNAGAAFAGGDVVTPPTQVSPPSAVMSQPDTSMAVPMGAKRTY